MNKKVATFLLAVVMSVSSVIAVSAENTEVETETVSVESEKTVELINSDEFNALYAMGFLGDELKSMDKNAYITRAQFTGYLFKLADYTINEHTQENIPFVDVNAKTPYYNEICTMYEMGIISGTEEGQFSPDNYITYAQASKLIVDILGYKAYAEIKYGEYPESYVLTAGELELNDGIKDVKSDSALSVENAVKMLYNAGLTEIVTFKGVDKNGNVKAETDGTTLLEKKHDVYFAKGELQCNGIASIESAEITDGVYVIDGIEYDVKDEKLSNLLGYRVNFLYRKKDGRGQLVWAWADARFSKVIELRAEELAINDSEYSLSNIVYYTDNGDKKNLKLKPLVDVIYNNSYYEIPAESIIKPKNGKMRLIDNDNDDYYDIVIIEEFYNIVVKHIAPTGQHIVDKYNRTVNMNDYDYVKIIRDDKEIAFDELTSGIVISCVENREKNRLYMYVTKDYHKGTLKSVGTSRGYKIYNFEDGSYRISSDFERVMSDTNIVTVTPRIGRKYVYYLDMSGEIAEIIDTNTAMQYALLMSARAGEAYEEGIVYTRLLLSDGTKVSGITNKKLIIDGVKKNASELMSVPQLYDDGGALKVQVVKVAFDEDGYLREIDFAKDITNSGSYFDTEEFSLDISKVCRTELMANIRIADYMYMLNEDAVVFTEWTGIDMHEPYTVGNKNMLFSGTYKMELYDSNQNLEVAAAFKQTSASEMWVDGRMIVDSIDYVYNDGEEVKRVSGYIKSNYVSYTELYPGVIPDNLECGDIVKLGIHDEKLSNVIIIFSAKDYEDTTAKLIEGIEPYAIDVIMYTPIYNISSSAITFVNPEQWKESYGPATSVPITNVKDNITIFDTRRKEIYKGDMRDIYQAYAPQGDGTLPDKDDLIMAYVGLRYGILEELILMVR